MCRLGGMIVALLVGTMMTATAQKGTAQQMEKEWDKIKQMMEEQSYKAAFEAAENACSQAAKKGNGTEMLISNWYAAQCAAAYQEDVAEKCTQRFEELLPKLDGVNQMVCHSLLTQLYNSYSVRYAIDESERETKLAEHRRLALKDKEALKNAKIDAYQRMCQINGNNKNLLLTPTVYDMLMRAEMEMCENAKERMAVLQEMADFHAMDNDDLRIYLDIELLDAQDRIANGKKATVEDWEALIAKYGKSESTMKATLYLRAARMLKDQKEMKRALDYCDIVTKNYPKSDEAKECAALREEITLPHIDMGHMGIELCDRHNMTVIRIRNVETLYCRIVACDENERESIKKKELLKKKVLQQWSQSLGDASDHLEHACYCYLPPMPTGHYILIVSASQDFTEYGYEAVAFDCCDATLVSGGTSMRRNTTGYVVNQKTGKPIGGVKVRLEEGKNNKYKTLSETTTDANGWYALEMPKTIRESWQYYYYVALEYDGFTVRMNTERLSNTKENETPLKTGCSVMTDRPVYRLGEEVSFACVVYRSDNWKEAEYVAKSPLKVMLRDVNYREVDTMDVWTDEHGMAYGSLKIPKNALPGYFHLAIERPFYNNHDDWGYEDLGSRLIKVEEYKQPKFSVTLQSEDGEYRYGKKCHLSGDAISYSGVPISNAKVSYRIERQQNRFWWYWRSESGQTVANGETETDGQGHFDVYFVPEADSNVELTDKTTFTYTLHATVTDLNGETHEQSFSIKIGQKNSFLLVNNAENVTELKELKFQYQNLDGKAVGGNVSVEIDQLRPPQPTLTHRHSDNEVRHLIDRTEFVKMFPGMAYDASENDPNHWATERRVYSGKCEAQASKTENTLTLPSLADGVYRVTLTAIDGHGDRITESKIITLTSNKGKKCQSNDLLWSDISHERAEVGEKVTIRLGSRHKGVTVFCAIADGNGEVERKVIELSDEMKSVEVDVNETMLGGFRVTLVALKEGVEAQKEYVVEVPFSHKKLQLTLESFRDKMLPGSNEEWTIKIADKDGAAVQGVMTATLYDAALDNYGSLHWSLWPWRGNQSVQHLWLERSNLYYSWNEQRRAERYHSYPSPIKWSIDGSELIYQRRMKERMLMAKCAAPMYASMDMASEMEMDAEEESMEPEYSRVSMKNVADVANEAEVSATGAVAAEEESGAMRKNLNTLAFFAPCVESKDGVATLRFTMPEALTQWNLLALAHTHSLQTGTLSAQVVTQKQLMLMPMMPRFFRQGDSVTLAAKVSNLTEEEQQVTVSLELTDAESGKSWGEVTPVVIKVPAKGNEVARFGIVVPQNSHAVVCKMMARGKEHSDGEQNVVAVLSNRQMVTESQAMYVNGVGTKHYVLPSLAKTETREPRLLAVEFTSNPIWLAIQALPYVSEQKNPSNIYLFNQYFCNAVSQRIVGDNAAIAKVFEKWQADTVNKPQSRIEMNEDLKQTLTEECPWLNEAQDETENIHKISYHFDSKRLAEELEATSEKVKSNQREDGGWSWMPEGNYSSEYTTRYMLRMFGQLSLDERKPFEQSIGKALSFVDQEVAKDYAQYMKDKVKDAYDADYLYIRSCYPEKKVSLAAQEAYRYYMNNAKRLCLKQSGLYHRALLAIVMQRAGEKALAQKLIEQLRQCSLTSDEMGMYWRDNVSGLCWNERPIEVQSFLIAAFQEVMPKDTESIGLMRQWLLKQKQTTSWNSDVASVAAITALLEKGSSVEEGVPAKISVGRETVESPAQAGTGYVAQRWTSDKVDETMREITIEQSNKSIGWGAAYWQYLDDIDKIASSSMGIGLQKTYLKVEKDGTLTPIKDGDAVQVGDRIKIQILVTCDRHLEYLELKDSRPAGFEPVNSASGWRWCDGLSYYEAVTNTALYCYIDRLDKGKYVVSYDLYATQEGRFSTGLSMMQSLYAPEFRALGASRVLTVRK